MPGKYIQDDTIRSLLTTAKYSANLVRNNGRLQRYTIGINPTGHEAASRWTFLRQVEAE